MVAFWRALAAPPRGLASILDLVSGAGGGERATAATLEAARALPWAAVARGALSCYPKVLVGAPCCSGYPFNPRGREDLLGPFGDCMIEGDRLFSAASASSSGGPALASPSPPPAATTAAVATAAAAATGPLRGPYRRAAAASARTARVLVLDRDECDRRIANPAELVRPGDASGLS